METAPVVELVRHSPLAAARLRRKLTIEEAAKRAGLTLDEVSWLEEGRVYRFRTVDEALNSCLVLATALEIDRNEAREMAGLGPQRAAKTRSPLVRLVAVGSVAALLSAVVVGVVFSTFDLGGKKVVAAPEKAPTGGPALPPPWKIRVDVLNGAGDINDARRIADRVTSFGYHVQRVTKAARFDYLQTAVYYEPGGQGIGVRLAKQLGVPAKPLPAGKNKLRLVVITGQRHGPGD